MRNFGLASRPTRLDTAAPSVDVKNRNTAILIISGVGLIGIAVAAYVLSFGVEREITGLLFSMP